MQGDIGIRNKRHCAEIVKHIAELPREEEPGEQAAEELRIRNKVTLCVEGNISAGKTTFLQRLLATSVELRDIVQVHAHRFFQIGGPPLLCTNEHTTVISLGLRQCCTCTAHKGCVSCR